MADEKKLPDAPRVSMRDRRIMARLQNPFDEPSAPVEFKDKSRIARWFNAAIIEDKIFRAKNKGWNLCYEDDIADKDQLGGYSLATDGHHIVRGDRGKEVLMWMNRQDYHDIQMVKARRNSENIGNPGAQHKEIVEAAAKRFGDEAADFLNRKGRISGSVIDKKEIVERIDG